MSESYFPLYPFANDPLRILSRRPSTVRSAVECSEAEARERAQCMAREEPDPPREDGAAVSPSLEEGREAGARAAEPPDDPSRTGEDGNRGEPEAHELIAAWLPEHWDAVLAMARAGTAPILRQAQDERVGPQDERGGSAQDERVGSAQDERERSDRDEETSPPTSAHPEPVEGPEPAEGAEAAEEPGPQRPIPYVARGDRWTKPMMGEFLRQLAATQNVSKAARSVGKSRYAAYKLRARLKGQPFDIAWEAAFRHGYDELAHSALELALEGEEVPHYYQGELKGTHRKRHPHLITSLLKMRNRVGAPMLGRYGAAAEFHSENWDAIVHRVETGPVRWDDEIRALSDEDRAKLGLEDEQKIEQIIVRNLPDGLKDCSGG